MSAKLRLSGDISGDSKSAKLTISQKVTVDFLDVWRIFSQTCQKVTVGFLDV